MLKIGTDLYPGQKIVRAEEYQAVLSAEEIVADARRQAESIIARANEEAEQLKEEGFQQGLAEGRLDMAERMVDTVSRSVDYFASMEARIVGIVTKALRKILGEIDHRERIVSVVRNALALARNQTKVTVRVSPGEMQTVQDKIEDVMRPYPAVQFIDVVADGRLTAGGCILETRIGVIDATVDVQIQAIEKSLAKTLGSRPHE